MTKQQAKHGYNAAWSAGRVAGLQLKGIGSNPYNPDDYRSEAWEDGYKQGREERAIPPA